MKQIPRRLTYANVMSSLAVFLVLGGATAFAAGQLGKNTVGPRQLKKSAVTTAKIKNGAVTEAKIANGAVTGAKVKTDAITTEKVKDGAITGAKVNTATLGTVPSATAAATLSGYSREGMTRVTATGGQTFDEAATAAPAATLYEAGPFTVYGKCLLFENEVHGIVFIKTSENGAIFDSGVDSLAGNPIFLNADTSEDDRELGGISVPDVVSKYLADSPEFGAMAPNGTVLNGHFQVAARMGGPAGGQDPYGPGDVCLFAGDGVVLGG